MSKERLEVIEAKLIMAKEESISSFTDEFLDEVEYLINRIKNLEKESKLYCEERCRKARLFYDDYGI